MDRLIRVARRAGARLRDQAGASLVEYALIVALIAIVSIGAIRLVGEKTFSEYDCVSVEVDRPGTRRGVTEKIRNNKALDSIEKKYANECL